MTTIRFTRGEADKKTSASVLIRIVTEGGRVFVYEADVGDFNRGLADHKPFSVEEVEPEVRSPRAS